MVSIKLRFIREINRIYSLTLNLLRAIDPHGSKVFLFHDILDDVSQVKSQFAISQKSFEAFLLFQLSKGYHPNTFDELSQIISEKKKKQDDSFIISFDDANESVYTKAYPFLKLQNISFIVFVTETLIGKPNFLTKAQVIALSKDPLCTLGSHSCHHVMFRYLSRADVMKELKESKLFLEKLINLPVISFAFPYGRLVECSIKNIEQIKNSNYQFSFSAISGNLNQSWFGSKFFLPRINIDEITAKKSLITHSSL